MHGAGTISMQNEKNLPVVPPTPKCFLQQDYNLVSKSQECLLLKYIFYLLSEIKKQ